MADKRQEQVKQAIGRENRAGNRARPGRTGRAAAGFGLDGYAGPGQAHQGAQARRSERSLRPDALPGDGPAHEAYAIRALVLQGGGALGAYQAGVYQGLAEGGIHPNWIAGISIGALNAAVIAGNPPETRVDAVACVLGIASAPSRGCPACRWNC